MRKHLRDVKRLARKHGRTVIMAHSGHLRLVADGLTTITASATPSCQRALQNLQADLRRDERQT